jgi:hypothetical protein
MSDPLHHATSSAVRMIFQEKKLLTLLHGNNEEDNKVSYVTLSFEVMCVGN